MSWRTLQVTDLELKFQQFELATWQNIETGGAEGADLTAGMAARLANAINAFLAAMAAAGYSVQWVKPPGAAQVPDQLREDILNYAAWQWVSNFPGQKSTEEFKTDARRQAYSDAQKNLEKIRLNTYGNIEDPYGQEPQSANWNSRPKVLMRTDPVPLPILQWQGTNNQGPQYANQNSRGDVPRRSGPQLGFPVNLQAQSGNNLVTLSWDAVPGATSYNVYRCLLSGQETTAGTAVNVGPNYFQDSGVTNGTLYYYMVQAVSGSFVSDISAEVSVTPVSNIASITIDPTVYTGTLQLAQGVSSGSVTGLALTFTPTKVFVDLQRPAGGDFIMVSVDTSTLSSDGFSFDLSSATTSSSFVLDYILST